MIKSPMDMGTIKRKLEQNSYYSAKECITDFRQMFNNCYTYNKPTDVRVMMSSAKMLLYLDIAGIPPPHLMIESPTILCFSHLALVEGNRITCTCRPGAHYILFLNKEPCYYARSFLKIASYCFCMSVLILGHHTHVSDHGETV